MKPKLTAIYLLVMLAALLFCSNEGEQRKIKLSDDDLQKNSTQTTTTLKLEPGEQHKIAVLFFENHTGDQNLDWLEMGLTEMLIRALSQYHSLSVLSTERLSEVFTRFSKNATPMNLNLPALVGKETNVSAVLTGNIVTEDNRLKINLFIKEPNQGRDIKRESVAGNGLADIFSMVDELCQKIKQDLQITLTPEGAVRSIEELTTNSLEAWQYYSGGVDYLNQLAFNQAAEQFEKAIELDSTFVMAYIQLFEAYSSMQRMDKSIELYERLIELRKYASIREIFRIDLIENRIKRDIQSQLYILKEWIKQFPNEFEAYYELGDMYFNQHDYCKAVQFLEKAREIDPKNLRNLNILGYAYAFIGNYEKALEILNQYQKRIPDDANPYDSIGEVYYLMGEYDTAEKYYSEALERADTNITNSSQNLGKLFQAKGEFEKALKYYHEYSDIASATKHEAITHYLMAVIFQKLNNPEQAIEHIEKSLTIDPFQSWAVTKLHHIYQNQGDSSNAKLALVASYDRMKNRINSEVFEFAYLHQLTYVSLLHDFRTEETIDILKFRLSTVANESMKMRIRFLLAALYAKNNMYQQFKDIWDNNIATRIVTLLKETRYLSRTYFWQFYAYFNQVYANDFQLGEDSYRELISHAKRKNAGIFEFGFRQLLTDLYLQNGDENKAIEQLKMIGSPNENHWMIIGPFENENGFNKAFPPEKKINLSGHYIESSKSIHWKHHADGINDGFVDLTQRFENSDLNVAYAVIYLKSKSATRAQLRFGNDDGIKIWVNKKLVWRMNRTNPAIPDNYILDTELKRGLNRILIKICNDWGDWGFYFRVTDKNGNGINNIEFIPADEIES